MPVDYTDGYTPAAPDEGPKRQEVIGGIFNSNPGTQISGSLAGGGQYQGDFTHPYRAGAINRILGNQLDSGGLADLQMLLVEVGLLGEDDVVFGYADDKTRKALRTVLAIANQQGTPWQDVLSSASTDSLQLGTQNTPAAADIQPQIVLPNREELLADIDDAVFTRTGVRYDPEVLERMTEEAMDHARDLQLTEFRQRNAGEIEEGRTVDEFVEHAIEEKNPEAVMEHDIDEKAASWFSAIRSPV